MKPNKYFPILIDLSKFRILIIGGGKVAERKVKSLLKFNAVITVLSPDICSEINQLHENGSLKVLFKNYEKEDLNDFDLVFSTIDNPEISSQIAAATKEKFKLLNCADQPDFCDFILPANIIRDNLTVSISSQGSAPYYVKYLKEKLELILSPLTGNILLMAAKFRNEIIKNHKNIDENRKRKLFQDFLKIPWENVLKDSGDEEAELLINNIFKENNG